jgi:hypothetical protein
MISFKGLSGLHAARTSRYVAAGALSYNHSSRHNPQSQWAAVVQEHQRATPCFAPHQHMLAMLLGDIHAITAVHRTDTRSCKQTAGQCPILLTSSGTALLQASWLSTDCCSSNLPLAATAGSWIHVTFKAHSGSKFHASLGDQLVYRQAIHTTRMQSTVHRRTCGRLDRNTPHQTRAGMAADAQACQALALQLAAVKPCQSTHQLQTQ